MKLLVLASGLETSTLGYVLVVLALTALPLWGAVDATLLRQRDWEEAGRGRTLWVALQGIGAPFGVGFVAMLVYVAKIRREVVRAAHLSGRRRVAGGPHGRDRVVVARRTRWRIVRPLTAHREFGQTALVISLRYELVVSWAVGPVFLA